MQHAKDFKTADLADAINSAMQRAYALIPASDSYGFNERADMARKAGVDVNLAAMGEFELAYRVSKQLAFGLGVDFYFEAVVPKRDGMRQRVVCETKISWASGGGTPSEAVAISTLHLDMATRAAQLEMSFNDALRHIQIDDEKDRNAFHDAFEDFVARYVKPAHEACRAAWKAAHGE